LAQADPKRAAALLKQVAVAQPERADAHYWLGQAYWALNRPIDAIAQFEAVVSLRADFVGAWKALGDLYLKQGNQAQAVTAYRRYLALEPEDVDTLARVDELEKLLDTNR